MLRTNQCNAVEASVKNNFSSGVHSHATGTGKSWIALELILKYNELYPTKNIMWLCEQKSILVEQFNRQVIKTKGYNSIFERFMILNYTENKPREWYSHVNSSRVWKKPLLLIINRAFLVSQLKYQKINIKIDLIIHDECHSIKNKTTRAFYNFILSKHDVSCIGFSATPCLKFKPFDRTITNYSIYNAYKDKVIVKPVIKWVDRQLNDIEIIFLCKMLINNLPYKKIVVWCGLIETCFKLSKIWNNYFENFIIAIDTSKDNSNFEAFKNADKNAILFCACKHREGSDIKNLDCCIFLDKVRNRNANTFVQCIGRVLRKSINKDRGLIIDLKAKNALKICERLNISSVFPWKYTASNLKIDSKDIKVHSITFGKNKPLITPNQSHKLESMFIRKFPLKPIYSNRLQKELRIIYQKKLEGYLVRAVEILNLTDNIPHVTRGSCGSSLVCYLMGISNVDPIKHDIKFERFLNDYRDNLPDIDLDFPHVLRDDVFFKLQITWPNQVARISNHVHWHEKSSLREAIRRSGFRKRIPKELINKFINSLPSNKRQQILRCQNQLNDTFRHYSLHCGGIVFFHDGIPEELKLNSKNQIKYDKHDVSKYKNFKIDILSNRGISQLMGICGRNIDFADCPYDSKTYELLQRGDNIGITLAESPLMRKALIKMKPKSITDIAICLAIIRPAAKDESLIFDDDAISILAKELNVSNDLADKFRRCISKNKWDKETKKKFDRLTYNLDLDLSNLRKYSFCKAHSYSYAQLVYKLAYEKAHNPKKFWKSTLAHNQSSYRKWVHLYEARRHNVFKMEVDKSIYCKKKDMSNLTKYQQLKKFGYWDMKFDKSFFPNSYIFKKGELYYFSGIIASLRCLTDVTILSIGVGEGKYIEILSHIKPFNNIGLKGSLVKRNDTFHTLKIQYF